MSAKLKIGFIGGGQLARMSAHSAIKLGHSCIFYSQDIDGPCKDLGQFFTNNGDELNSYIKFAESCDIVTLENEYIDSQILLELEKIVKVFPSYKSFEAIEDKFKEKVFFKSHNIPVANFKLIKSFKTDIETFSSKTAYPVMLKSVKGGYDGFGNYLAKSFEDAKIGFNLLGGNKGQDIILEEVQNFKAEVAVTIARNVSGQLVTYPVVDSIQKDNICVKVIAPSTQSIKVQQEVQKHAIIAMKALDAVGVFSFEFFVLEDDRVVLNESAPRPHNSAHYTMDACKTSQFENHILAITDMPLGKTDLKCKKAIMENILGKEAPKEIKEGEFLHMYGKNEIKPKRKMGHINKLYF